VAGLERALPGSWYPTAEAFHGERERVLYREWFCAGRADQVERPGPLAVVEVAGESVLLVRTRTGKLAATTTSAAPRLPGGAVPAGVAGRPPGHPGPQGRFAALPLPLLDPPVGGRLLRAPWSEEIDDFDRAGSGCTRWGWRPGAGSCSRT
jgi:hypothetical protein